MNSSPFCRRLEQIHYRFLNLLDLIYKQSFSLTPKLLNVPPLMPSADPYCISSENFATIDHYRAQFYRALFLFLSPKRLMNTDQFSKIHLIRKILLMQCRNDCTKKFILSHWSLCLYINWTHTVTCWVKKDYWIHLITYRKKGVDNSK